MKKDIVKQIIVVRKDLIGLEKNKMGYGKLGAQIAHASIAPIIQKMRGGIPHELISSKELENEEYRLFLDLKNGDPIKKWLEGSFRKIILYVKNENQLLKKYNEIKKAGFTVTLIKDSGFTVFEEPTITCFGIEPLYSEQIDPYTRKLRLLD